MSNQVKKLNFFASDLESTGLLHDLRKQGHEARLHNFALMSTASDKYMILHPMEGKDREKLQSILNRGDTVLIMHNGICYDLEALKFFGFDVSKVKIVDTLYLAWYLDFHAGRNRFGLESYGEDFGVPKPPIDDWENLTQEEYDNRVYGDINIQKKLWLKLCRQFAELYGIAEDGMMETNVFNHHCMKYLMWKGELLRQQQESKWKFEVEKAEPLLQEIEQKVEEKFEALKGVMPPVPVYKVAKPPSKRFKKNGTLSETGKRWKELAEQHGFNLKHNEEIKYIGKYNEPNPASPQQVKDWLYSLGWVPETFEFKKDENGERSIPQVYIKNSGGKVCPSVEKLAEENPDVAHLVGLGVYKHRKAMVAGWLSSHREGFLEARANGFTNTLRLKHAELVNIPSGRVLLGQQIRSLLVVRDPNHTLTGSDLSSLESRWKFHHQFPLDPDYVNQQMSEDFDPHLALAEIAGLLTNDEVNFYKVKEAGFPASMYGGSVLDTMLSWPEDQQVAEVKRIAKLRAVGKNGTYACQYGAGAKTVARTAKVGIEIGKQIVDGYRELNWSIDVIASNCFVKKTSFGDFLLNPTNKMFYPLKTAKDRFSTLIQGSGSYTLDLWLMFQNRRIVQADKAGKFKFRPMLLATFHDEEIYEHHDDDTELMTSIIQDSMKDTNEALKLNVELGCDIKHGKNYYEIH